METHEEYMNRMATDITECDKCESEDVSVIEWGGAEDPDKYTYKCLDCGHSFIKYD